MQEILSHPIPAVVFMLGVLVFVHEFGHFIVGKACGLGVEVFSLGFGPRLIGVKVGATDYRISGFPLGGYVKFAGAIPSEHVSEAFRGKEMYKAAPWKRALTISAGPVANLILASVAYMTLGMAGIQHPAAVIGEVRSGSPAEKAGLLTGDEILKISDQDIKTWRDMQAVISKTVGKAIDITVNRNGQELMVNVKPDIIDGVDIIGRERKQGRIGIGYGFLPPILTLTSTNSAAALQGLKTGDQIAYIYTEKGEEKVTNWPQFLRFLEQSYRSKAHSITLSVFPSSLDLIGKRQSPKEGELRKVEIDTALWSTFEVGELSGIELQSALSKALGLADSQLTVGEAKEPMSQYFQNGDRLISFEGNNLIDIYDLYEKLQNNKSQNVTFQIQRGDKIESKKVELKAVDVQKPSGLEVSYTLPVIFLGNSIHPEPYIEKYSSVFSGLAYGVSHTLEQSAMVVGGIWGLITGDVPLKALGGPMLIAKVAGDSAKLGWQAFLTALALISINLGMINLFPIPVLDGGQLVMVGIEGVRRRPLSESAIENYQKIGFVMVMALVILATYNDFSRFWKSMMSGVAGLF